MNMNLPLLRERREGLLRLLQERAQECASLLARTDEAFVLVRATLDLYWAKAREELCAQAQREEAEIRACLADLDRAEHLDATLEATFRFCHDRADLFAWRSHSPTHYAAAALRAIAMHFQGENDSDRQSSDSDTQETTRKQHTHNRRYTVTTMDVTRSLKLSSRGMSRDTPYESPQPYPDTPSIARSSVDQHQYSLVEVGSQPSLCTQQALYTQQSFDFKIRMPDADAIPLLRTPLRECYNLRECSNAYSLMKCSGEL